VSNVILGLIFSLVILFCAWIGYITASDARHIVTLSAGFSIGATSGFIVALLVFMLAFVILDASRLGSATHQQATPPVILIFGGMLLGVLAAGTGGSLAAWRKPNRWSKRAVSVSPQTLAPGSQHPFTWYFEGQSTVPATSLGEICEWLQTCEYASDIEQFHAVDYWQQPVAFEHTRQGDCEDHALWAWRKLIERGYAAEFMLGKSYRYQAQGEVHAWVIFRHNGTRYLLEAAYKQSHMIAPLASVQYLYQPTYGVDENLQMYRYNRPK
jgi:hypothetical protein